MGRLLCAQAGQCRCGCNGCRYGGHDCLEPLGGKCHVRCPPIYLLTCKVCEPLAPMPFSSQADRGQWASEHTAGTGHESWKVEDPPYETKGNSEVPER